MSDLLTQPLYLPEHLGRPIPQSPHAVSACLPTWADAIGYEEEEPRVINKLAAGYPRFVYHPVCRALFERCDARFADESTTCLAFGSGAAAQRFGEFLAVNGRATVHQHEWGDSGAIIARFDKQHANLAKSFWQHTGEGISSRHAQACLEHAPMSDGRDAKQTLRQRIGDLAGVGADHIYLFPNGMAGIYCLHRALNRIAPNRKTVQFGFPYVDTLKIIQKFGSGAMFYPQGNQAELEALGRDLAATPACGIFTELPSNPLLVSPDLVRLAALARQHDTPLVIDDTIATWVNADAVRYADVTCNSLTKSFSGAGDVAGGCVIVNPRSRHFEAIRTSLDAIYEDLLVGPDAEQLEHNSRDFVTRQHKANDNAMHLLAYLEKHPKIQRVYHPLLTARDRYEQVRRDAGGFGSLISIDLKDPATNAPKFYDRLRVCKGPNLGTNYTLVCPYTILAHYDELDWAETCGVSRWLIRISVGLEDPADLIDRFAQALN